MLEKYLADPAYSDHAPKSRTAPQQIGRSCGSCSGSGQQCHKCKQAQTLANPYPEWREKK